MTASFDTAYDYEVPADCYTCGAPAGQPCMDTCDRYLRLSDDELEDRLAEIEREELGDPSGDVDPMDIWAMGAY